MRARPLRAPQTPHQYGNSLPMVPMPIFQRPCCDNQSNVSFFLYLQMESCQEFTLSNVLQRMRDHGSQEVPIVDRIQCMCELAEALQHTHLSGIMHRDIKPDNIFSSFPARSNLLTSVCRKKAPTTLFWTKY